MTQVQQIRTAAGNLAEFAAALQQRHEARTSPQHRRERGQFFTPPRIGAFMAGLLSIPRGPLRILDAGAGTGTLSAAICARILRLRAPRSVHFVLFETDALVVGLLDECMQSCRQALMQAGHRMTYTIERADFVLSNRPNHGQGLLFTDEQPVGEFNAAVMNPPYFKLNKGSAHARALERVVHGQPNIYALFMATAAALLRPGGELVAITPRSFCNGLYFRGFRRWFFERMVLRHIHLFESRTETFEGADVLQESLITAYRKSTVPAEGVTLTTSRGADLNGVENASTYPTSHIIDDSAGDCIVRIPGTPADAEIMAAVESWPRRFTDHGLRISTGPVVAFRAREYLLDNADAAHAVPLLLPHNIRPFETHWPVRKHGKPLALRLCPASEKLVLPARNYVLLRRFSAKEEHRRLTASCFLPVRDGWPTQIAIENHVNYVYHAGRELTEAEALGLAAVFNSALMDRYFRTLSGNTQVNATEIRALPFPGLDALSAIGGAVAKQSPIDRDAVERVVLTVLGVDGAVARALAGREM